MEVGHVNINNHNKSGRRSNDTARSSPSRRDDLVEELLSRPYDVGRGIYPPMSRTSGTPESRRAYERTASFPVVPVQPVASQSYNSDPLLKGVAARSPYEEIESVHTEDTFPVPLHPDVRFSGQPSINQYFVVDRDNACVGCEEGRQFAWTGHIIKSRWFKRLSIALILSHCMVASAATFDFATDDPDVRYRFDLAKDVYTYIMSAELMLHFMYHGIGFFSRGWLVFDLIWVGSAWLHPNLLVMRTFRVVRTMRLASTMRDLRELALALLMVIPKMFAIFLLLLVLFFVFSILFTDLFKDCYKDGTTGEDYFSRLDITLFTLFQIMTLDGWSKMCKEVMVVYQWAWIPFLGFVVLSSFFFLNLVIAVVCDAVTSVHRDRVVKYIQDDISAATSVREALNVENKLEDLAAALQTMMNAQVTVLEALHEQHERSVAGSIAGDANDDTLQQQEDLSKRLQEQKEALQQQVKVIRNRVVTSSDNSTTSRQGPGSVKGLSNAHPPPIHLNPMDPSQDQPSNVSSLADQSLDLALPQQQQVWESFIGLQPPTIPETVEASMPEWPLGLQPGTIPETVATTADRTMTASAPKGESYPPSPSRPNHPTGMTPLSKPTILNRAEETEETLPEGLQEHMIETLTPAQRTRLVRVLQQDRFKAFSPSQRAKVTKALVRRLAAEGPSHEELNQPPSSSPSEPSP